MTMHELPRLDATVATLPRIARLRLPARFDVHRTAEFVEALVDAAAGADEIRIDGSDVEMIDLAGIETLDHWADRMPIRFEQASVALAMTIRLAGPTRLAELELDRDLLQAA